MDAKKKTAAKMENRVKRSFGFCAAENLASAKACIAVSKDVLVGGEQKKTHSIEVCMRWFAQNLNQCLCRIEALI